MNSFYEANQIKKIGFGSFGKNVLISKFANISTRVSIFSSSDDFSGESLTNPTTSEHFKKLEKKAAKIEKHVIIGTNSTVLPGVNLHEGCAIGAHSLVKLSCPEYKNFAGVPVKEVGKRSEKLKDLEVNFLKNNKYQ